MELKQITAQPAEEVSVGWANQSRRVSSSAFTGDLPWSTRWVGTVQYRTLE
jgi:hypothetical protein